MDVVQPQSGVSGWWCNFRYLPCLTSAECWRKYHGVSISFPSCPALTGCCLAAFPDKRLYQGVGQDRVHGLPKRKYLLSLIQSFSQVACPTTRCICYELNTYLKPLVFTYWCHAAMSSRFMCLFQMLRSLNWSVSGGLWWLLAVWASDGNAAICMPYIPSSTSVFVMLLFKGTYGPLILNTMATKQAVISDKL